VRPAKQPTASVALYQKRGWTPTLFKPSPPPLPMDFRPASWPRPPVFFLQSLLCVATMQQPFVLSILATSCPTLFSHLSLSFLPPRPPPKIHIGILLLNNLTTCPTKINLLTLYPKPSWGCCVQKIHAWDHFDCFMKNVRFDVLNSN
jgi:hypothetical protein